MLQLFTVSLMQVWKLYCVTGLKNWKKRWIRDLPPWGTSQSAIPHQTGTGAHTVAATATSLVTAVIPSPVSNHGYHSQGMGESRHEVGRPDIPLSGIAQSEHNQHSNECDGMRSHVSKQFKFRGGCGWQRERTE